MTLLTVAGRAERLLTALDERGLDQMIVSDQATSDGCLGYWICWRASDSARGHVLITDGRYTNQAGNLITPGIFD